MSKYNYIFLALLLSLSSTAQASKLKQVTMCAFTMMGEGGQDYQAIVDYKTAAMNWGVNLKLKSYMNEKIVVEELKAGQCDIANMTSIQALKFNKFSGSFDAPGAMPTYDHLKMVMKVLSTPKARKYMRDGEYETVGMVSAGAVYLFANYRDIRSLSDLAGKRMAVLESMPEMSKMVTDMGMTPVYSTVTNVFQKFNNNVVDLTGGPAIVYEMMELHKGLEPNGGILATPLVQASLQFIARWEHLPEGFGQKSREYFASRFDESMDFIKSAENSIPEKYWIHVPDANKEQFNTELYRVRLSFRDQGVYSSKALTLMRKVRCKIEPVRAECTSASAE